MKNLFILGTRPEAIKMIPLIQESINRSFITDVCITGQHLMVEKIIKNFNINVRYNFKIMKHNQSLNQIFYRCIKELEKNIHDNYDFVFVHGDTTTACASSVWAFNKMFKVIHIEAGLRSFNKMNPFPEEINRILIDHIASIHFAPTKINRLNLRKENISENVFVVGNTVIDMLKIAKNMLSYTKEKDIVLFTCHRRENIPMLEIIFKSINDIALMYKNLTFMFILHPNKKIIKVAEKMLTSSNIKKIKALEYLDFINLLLESKYIITDSGGVLEESAFLCKKVLIIRNSLEREELLSNNIIISNINYQKIINSFNKLLKINSKYGNKKNILGNGDSSKKIFDIIENYKI